MSNQGSHQPGRPTSPEPPRRLLDVVDSFRHPEVTRIGLTTTAEGAWALMVRVRPGAHVPIQEIEAACGGCPVVYQDEPEELPVARPAYPAKGE
jgi:hypothetical protein